MQQGRDRVNDEASSKLGGKISQAYTLQPHQQYLDEPSLVWVHDVQLVVPCDLERV